jgi:hypothetical protein
MKLIPRIAVILVCFLNKNRWSTDRCQSYFVAWQPYGDSISKKQKYPYFTSNILLMKRYRLYAIGGTVRSAFIAADPTGMTSTVTMDRGSGNRGFANAITPRFHSASNSAGTAAAHRIVLPFVLTVQIGAAAAPPIRKCAR